RLGEPRARDVLANPALRASRLEHSANGCGHQSLELLAARPPAIANDDDEEISEVDERTDRAPDALLDRNLVDPRRAQPLVRGLRTDTPERVEQTTPVREIAVPGRPRAPRGRGDIGEVRAFTARGERPRARLQDC